MTDGESFNLENLGSWSTPLEFRVEPERSIAYAEATNDLIGAHLDGTLAPPVFAVVPAMDVMAETTMAVVPDDLMLRILHGEHDFRFHRPIRPGETLRVRASAVGVEGKSSGVTVTTLIESRSAETDELVNEQYFIGFFRGGTFDGLVGQAAPEHAFEDSLRARTPDAEVETKFDADQTFRYAEPAGDPMPIHLDDDFAKQMGLPGIIMHGLCTNAMLSHVLIEHAAPDEPQRLARLAVRFSKPGIPGDTMTTRIWRSADRDGRAVYAFESTNSDGEHLIRDGLAEFTL